MPRVSARAALVVAAALAQLTLAVATASAAPAPGVGAGIVAPVPQQARLGGIFGVVPAGREGSRPTASALAGSSFATASNLLYNGGPVMHTNKTFAIYWIPSGYSVSPKYMSLINQYFTDVGAASGSTSTVYATDTQYYDTVNGNILNSSSFGGSYVDTSPLPASGCADSYTSVCLTDAQLRQEIQRVVTARGWQAGPTSLFHLFTARGIGSCFSSASSTCAFSYYCAYHSNIGSGSNEILYANMPYADTASTRCDAGPRPNGDDADATLNVTSHEHNEAITDPLGNAWYDSSGNENGDKCAWNFGMPLGSTANGQYNQLINGHPYYIQLEWSNATSSCVGSYGTAVATPPVSQGLPVVSGTAQSGQTLSASTGSWSGTQPLSFAYQWQRCGSGCVNVGSNSSSYLLSSADVGSTVRVVVTASNSAGSAAATSLATGVVSSQSTSGSVTVTLASGADNGEVDVNGAQSAGYPPSSAPAPYVGVTMTAARRLAYGGYGIYEPQLRFNTAGVLPAGATITSATLKVFVNRLVNGDGRNLVADWLPAAVWPLSAADWALAPVGDALAPVAVGSLAVGAVNSFSLTGFSNISTSGYTSLRLQIDGGQPAGDNYVQFATYQDSTAPKPQLVLTYTTASATPPVSQGLPVVSGTAQSGQTLSASTGSWSGTQPLSFAYQWQRCGSGCVNVGSNSSSYLLSSADVGSTVRVVVTASNSAGSAAATSLATGVVSSQSTSGSVTVTLASGADNGEVDVNGAQSAGYPPSSAPAPYVGVTMTAARRLAYGGYGIYEPQLRFNTAGVLPAGATITSATLKVFVNRLVNGDGRNLVADWLPAAVWPLSAADWALAPVGDALAPVAVGSLAVGAVNSFSLTGFSNISTSGYTSLRLQIDGGQPAGDNYVQFATYQDSTAPKPQLVLTYTTP